MTADIAGLPLWAQPSEPPIAPYRRNSRTSLAAAVKVTPSVRATRLLILRAIHKHGPMNADQSASLLGMNVLKVRPRFCELHAEKYGLFLLEPTGETAPSSLGNPMDVYRLSAKGEAQLKGVA